MMNERGLSLDHTTIYRWVQAYAPELEKRIRPHLRPTNDSYSVDETYVKIKGEWEYLYRSRCSLLRQSSLSHSANNASRYHNSASRSCRQSARSRCNTISPISIISQSQRRNRDVLAA